MSKKYQYVNMEDYVFFQEGPGLRTYQWAEKGMKVITIGVVKGNGIIDYNYTNKYISMDEFNKKYQHFLIEENDIIVTTSGVSYGKVAKIREEHLPLMMNTSLIRFHSKSIYLDNDFLYAYIRSKEFKEQMDKYALGSAQPNFGPSHVKFMNLPLPNIETQKKIGLIFKNIEEKILINTEINTTLEQMAQTLYKNWFVDVNNMELVSIDKFADILSGGTPKTSIEEYWNGDIPWVSVKDLSNSVIYKTEKTITDLGIQKSATKLLPVNSTIMSARGTIGTMSMIGIPMTMNQSCFAFHSKYGQSTFVYFAMKNSIERLISTSNGSVFNTINKDTLFNLEFPFDEYKANKFEEVAGKWMELITKNSLENITLEETRDYLLPRLLSREIEISEAAKLVKEVMENGKPIV